MRHSMLKVLTAVCAIGVAAAPASAQFELGIRSGLTLLSNGEDVTLIGIPGAGIRGLSTISATFFSDNGLMVEPQLGLTRISNDGSLTELGFGARLGLLLGEMDESSAYVFADGALVHVRIDNGDDESNTEFGAGGGIGYRAPIESRAAFRIEGAFRRWFDEELNEVIIAIGLGFMLGS